MTDPKLPANPSQPPAQGGLWLYANPHRFMQISGRVLPWLAVLAATSLACGLVWGFFFTPPAEHFRATVKILFVHVPAALMAVNTWLMMFVASLFWLVRRHAISALMARGAAPIGAGMTVIALITGGIWGQSAWGTWWVFDPRLTSFLLLLLMYLGYMALWIAVEPFDVAADITGWLGIVGTVFALLSRYAARFWDQGLHQGTSLPMVTGGRTIADVYFWPLALCMIAFFLVVAALMLVRVRVLILIRQVEVRERQQRRGRY